MIFFFGGGDIKILLIYIFWGRHKTGLVLGVILCILGSFLKVNVQNGNIFFFLGGGGVLLKFPIFIGVCLGYA